MWQARYEPPERWAEVHVPIGSGRLVREGDDLVVVTFGNGVPMSLRAATRLAADGVSSRVFDLRWLAPLPVDDVLRHARETGRVLIVDETRASGGVAEALMAALIEGGFQGPVHRVAAHDTFIPLGDAANLVLVSEDEIVSAASSLAARAIQPVLPWDPPIVPPPWRGPLQPPMW